ALRGRYLFEGGKSEKEEKPKRDRRRDGRLVNQDTNLEYIDSSFRVRCVCGSLEEDGEMTLCDTCNFWLHSECLQDVDQDNEYKCQFCRGTIDGSRPCSDVVLAKQPEIRLDGCSYYK
ncbi:PHD-finger, partial [Ancylostoma duodenale]